MQTRTEEDLNSIIHGPEN